MKHISGMERWVGQKLNGMTDASAVCQTAVEIRTSGRSPLWPISRNSKTSKGNNSNLRFETSELVLLINLFQDYNPTIGHASNL